MADWIWNEATKQNVSDIEIDILNNSVSPSSLEIQPIVYYLS